MSDRVAVIGGGMAGLCAAYFMREKHDVTLFERQARAGGNAFTLNLPDGLHADIAVAAFGRSGYKNFYQLLDQLGVRTRRSGSGFLSVEDLDSGEGVYLSPTPRGLWAQNFDLLRPSRVRMLWQLSRSLAKARRIQAASGFEGLSMREGLRLLPNVAAGSDAETILLCALCLMSSMSGDEVLDAPAEFFFGKLAVHSDVISPRAFWSVRTVHGGTQAYIAALQRALGERVVLNAKIRSVARHDDGVVLTFEDGTRQGFDRVVFACNADRTLALLEDPTELELELLSPWRYKDGRLVVHRDHAYFPPDELMQAFTFLYRREGGGLETSVNGVMRFLADMPDDCDLIGSQHPNFPIRPELIVFDTVFRTPIFDSAAFAVQPRLPELNGERNCYHCGSHFGFGLHEDAVTSAMAAASSIDQAARVEHSGGVERFLRAS
ncbi:MAG: FAD-dependent oxidoreductase [Thermoleophilaceae bacterium]|nr:FAD-dependent oxidoreductase [Thermoleophilaceae bacterium]